MIYVTDSFKNNTSNNNSSGMDIFGIGSAIGGIAGAIGTAAAARQNRKAQEETNKANLLLAQRQNDWNIQQWEREMAYNSPANKLKLLEDAGLNPIWYGSNLGPTETQAPKSADLANQVAPQLDAGAIGSSLGNLTSSLIAAGQYHLTKRAQDLEERKIGIEEQRLGIESAKTTQDIEESKAVVTKMTQELENLKSQNKLTQAQYDNAVKQLEIMEQERLRIEAEVSGITLDNKQKETFLNQYADQLAAELNIKKAEAKELAAAAYNYIMAGDRAAAETEGIKLLNDLNEKYSEIERVGGVVAKGASLLVGFGRMVRKVAAIGKVSKFKTAATAAREGAKVLNNRTGKPLNGTIRKYDKRDGSTTYETYEDGVLKTLRKVSGGSSHRNPTMRR